ncbi:hypothetical protein HWV62_15343 [Athelia sp. TMB]|nr:hypothetical protein HWV62_15343 [Athelia sp. TMB]
MKNSLRDWPQNSRSIPQEYAGQAITASLAKFPAHAAPHLVEYYIYGGLGPPPKALGAIGDIYCDSSTTTAPELYSKEPNLDWRKWCGPDGLQSHPTSGDWVLWASTEGFAWISPKTAKQDAVAREGMGRDQMILQAMDFHKGLPRLPLAEKNPSKRQAEGSSNPNPSKRQQQDTVFRPWQPPLPEPQGTVFRQRQPPPQQPASQVIVTNEVFGCQQCHIAIDRALKMEKRLVQLEQENQQLEKENQQLKGEKKQEREQREELNLLVPIMERAEKEKERATLIKMEKERADEQAAYAELKAQLASRSPLETALKEVAVAKAEEHTLALEQKEKEMQGITREKEVIAREKELVATTASAKIALLEAETRDGEAVGLVQTNGPKCSLAAAPV